jgi:hypothetical protein
VRRKRSISTVSLADDLRQSASADAARELHLPKAVLCVDEPEREGAVRLRRREDMRDAVFVPHYFDVVLQAREIDRAGGLRQ